MKQEICETNHIPHPFELFGVECHKGWYKLLEPIFNYVEEYNKDKIDENKIVFLQIKEKWGYLNVYTNFVTEELSKLIDDAENASENMCEECGNTENVGTRTNGWVTTMCLDCCKQEAKDTGCSQRWVRHSDNKEFWINPDGSMEEILEMELYNNITVYNANCIDLMKQMEKNKQFVDLTVTSPPYDSLRTYQNKSEWNFENFKEIAQHLYNITNDGGVVVWVVGDATVNGSETGSSFKQALYFMELGFKLHDTMIYEKNSSSFPSSRNSKRYTQIFEYMFVFVKGKKIHDCTLLCDKPNKWAGHTNWGQNTQYNKEGELIPTNNIKPVPEFSLRNNIWKYSVGFNTKKFGKHPAVFPIQLAIDHILSWSTEDHVIFDPFLGSGTTMDACIKTNRKNFIGCEINEDYFNIIKKKIDFYKNGGTL